MKLGRAERPPRPWLGHLLTEGDGLVVDGSPSGAPAEKAGVELGDIVVEIAGERPHGLADLFRRMWRPGGRASRCRCSCRARASCCG